MFGCESRGIPYDLLANNIDNCFRLPTNDKVRSLNLSNCKAIFLMHLSDGHARELEFKEQFTKELNKKVYICQKYGGFK